MALSNALHEALREFTDTKKGGQSQRALADLMDLEDASHRGLAEHEDVAFGILERLYELQERHAVAGVTDKGKGSESLGVKKS